MGLEDIMDARAVARELGISVSAVHRLAGRGTLSSEWLAGRRVWKREAVRRYLADAAAQKRRRSAGGQPVLLRGGEEVPLDRAAAELLAQAPAGWDPVTRRRSVSK